ncbi:unnamed protein product [Caretta caretta]
MAKDVCLLNPESFMHGTSTPLETAEHQFTNGLPLGGRRQVYESNAFTSWISCIRRFSSTHQKCTRSIVSPTPAHANAQCSSSNRRRRRENNNIPAKEGGSPHIKFQSVL